MLSLSLTMALAAPVYREKSVKIPNGARPELAANIGIPETGRRVPCVVIAPGARYHKDRPLIKELASELRSEGLATVRFDWAFFTNQAQPSKDYLGEVADLQSAIKFARAQHLIDPDRVWVAGKSLGSVVAWKVFAADKELSGAILLTPIIPDTEPLRWLTGLSTEKRPLLFSVPDNDPAACTTAALAKALSCTGSNVRVQVHPGNHGFEVAKPTDLTPAKTDAANIAVVVKAAVNLLRSWLQ